MSLILLISTAICIVAMLWSTLLVVRLRDWRIGFLTAMIVFMTARQILTLVHHGDSFAISLTPAITELPGLFVSSMALAAVVFLGRFLRDVRRNEDSLRLTNQAIDCSITPVAFADMEGTLTRANRAFLDLWGFEREEEAIGLSNVELAVDGQRVKSIMEALVSRGSYEGEEVARRRNGTSFDVHFSATVLRAPSGRPLGTMATIIDVSDARRAERAVRESEVKYRTRAENAPICIHQVDLDGRLTSMNRAGLAMVGVDSEREILGTRFLDCVCDESRPRVEEKLQAAFQGQTSEVEFRSKYERWFRSVLAPIRRAEGKPFQLMGLTADVTERKRAEEAADRQREELARADKMIALGTLVSGVAHEINNPIHSIGLNLSVLHKVWADVLPLLDERLLQDPDLRLANIPYADMRQDVPRLIDEIERGAERIRRIVSELRNYSRGDASAELSPLSVNRVVRLALRLVRDSIHKATRRFSVECTETLPPVLGDPGRLEQVIVNLVLNACQALTSPEERIRVTTGLDPAAGSVVVTVEDGGAGISATDLPRVFDPFFTTKREVGGTGLGLAVARRIVDEHQGHLCLESEPGRGTTAQLSLPVPVEWNPSEVVESDERIIHSRDR